MTNPSDSLKLARLCAAVLEEKKAGDLRILDVSEQSSITNVLVVATATSAPHLRALRVELEKVLDASGAHIVGMETPHDSGWNVVDAFDVMIHLFLPEERARYRLEHLWKDGAEVAASSTKPKPAPKKKRKKAVRKGAAGSTKKKKRKG